MRLLPFLTLLLACGAFACGEEPGPNGMGNDTGWQPLSDVPLSSRENTVGIWTGEETLLVGGSNARPCPPNASCIAPRKPPLRDGVSFDPESRTWTEIESAPVGFSRAEGVTMNGRAYIWTLGENGRSGAPRAFLSYDPDKDRWARLPLPPVRTYSSIIATNNRIIAFSLSDEGTAWPDFAFDPSSGKWSKLPDDPLPPSFDRTMFWTGSQLVLLGKKMGELNMSAPNLPEAVSFNPETGTWSRLPAPKTLDQYATNVRWFMANDLVINPAPGEFQGYQGSWNRSYRDGGIFDPETEQWLDLPAVPNGVEEFSGLYGAGIVAGDESHYFGYEGWVLDAEDMSWIKTPQLREPEEVVGGRTVVAAGEDMLVFGGVRFDPISPGRLLNETWIWSPR